MKFIVRKQFNYLEPIEFNTDDTERLADVRSWLSENILNTAFYFLKQSTDWYVYKCNFWAILSKHRERILQLKDKDVRQLYLSGKSKDQEFSFVSSMRKHNFDLYPKYIIPMNLKGNHWCVAIFKKMSLLIMTRLEPPWTKNI